MTVDLETLEQFFDTLHAGGQVAHWWNSDGKVSIWFDTNKRKWYPSSWENDGNIYFCIHPCTQIPDNGHEEKEERFRKSRLEYVAAINCVFAEFDVKDYGDKDAILAHLWTLPIYPSVVIDSGGGYHCYWFLSSPVIVTEGNRGYIKRLQYAWVDKVGGDDASKDLARVLRVPGTKNRKEKYAPNYPVVSFVECDLEQVYSLAEIESILGDALNEPPPKKSSKRTITTTTTDELITAATCLRRLSAARADDYGDWLRVGMALHSLGDAGLQLWDEWSQQSDKYKDGVCDAKWASFTDGGVTLGSLVHMANEDDPAGKVQHGDLFGAMDDTPQTGAELFASLQEVAPADRRIDPDTGEILDDAPLEPGTHAIWRNGSYDEPVVITGIMGEQDSEIYYTIEGSKSGIPASQIINTEDGFGSTPSAARLLSPRQRVKYPVDGVKRIVKIKELNTALTVEGGPNVYDAEYADDTGAWWPITVSDDDDIELMTASAPKTAPAAAKTATIDDVLSAINVIANNADLKPTDRQKQIVRGLSTAIGAIDRSFHTEIVVALEQANATFTQTAAKEFVRGCVADAKKRNKAAERVRKEAARQNLLAVRAKKGKASIDVGNRQLSDIADEALQTLVASNASDPNVFVRGGALVRIVQDERCHYGIQEFTNGALLGKLAAVADWETVGLDDNGNPQSRAVFPPRDVVNTIIAAGEWPGIPALTGVVNAPVFSRNGELHDQPGYNAATRLYYTGGVKVGDTTPTPANIERAKDLILDNLLRDFPFRDEASFAHSVAYMILPFVRDMIDGPTPVHTVDSPTPGTGKGKNLNAGAYPFLGHDVPTQPAVEDDNEWRKIITARLLSGDTHMIIDNVNHELNSGALASAFTQPVWTDRTLGANRTVQIPIRMIWAITANNIQMSEELSRRCIWIRLDANTEKPWERSEFKHKDLIGWARANRDALATAVITIVRAWVDRGMTPYTKRVKGSYEAWARVIGGILDAVGIPGFLENESELYDRVASKTDMLADFVTAWAEKFGNNDTSAHELFRLASYADLDEENALGAWHNLLDAMLTSPKQRGRQTQLGNILNAYRDKVVAGYKVKWAKVQRGVVYWRLEAVNSGEPQKSGEPGFEVHHETQHGLPPVEGAKHTQSGEPGRTFPTYNASEGNFFSCLVNGTPHANGQEKNNSLYAAQPAEVLPGSPLSAQSQALPVVDDVVNLAKSGEPRFKVHHGKNEAAILEAASYRCQSCETSKWSVALRLIPVAGGYNVLCEKCAG